MHDAKDTFNEMAGTAGALFTYREIKKKMLEVLEVGMDPYAPKGSKGYMGAIRSEVCTI